MKIAILAENTAWQGFGAQHGLSYVIEHQQNRLLFDTGHSHLFLDNAKKMGIDVQSLQTVVLSHGHWDHGNGLQFLSQKKLFCHPDVFMKRYRQSDHSYIGLKLSEQQIEQQFDLKTSKKPLEVSQNVFFLGEIPRKNDFEAQTTTFVDQKGAPDFVPDDSGLAIVQHGELIVISGCAHAGICNTVQHARQITGIQKVKAVLGGFHLKQADTQTQQTIDFLKNNNIENVIPSHCTRLPALCAFRRVWQFEQNKAGMQIEI